MEVNSLVRTVPGRLQGVAMMKREYWQYLRLVYASSTRMLFRMLSRAIIELCIVGVKRSRDYFSPGGAPARCLNCTCQTESTPILPHLAR